MSKTVKQFEDNVISTLSSQIIGFMALISVFIFPDSNTPFVIIVGMSAIGLIEAISRLFFGKPRRQSFKQYIHNPNYAIPILFTLVEIPILFYLTWYWIAYIYLIHHVIHYYMETIYDINLQ